MVHCKQPCTRVRIVVWEHGGAHWYITVGDTLDLTSAYAPSTSCGHDGPQ